ncbi:MAG: glycerophosphodiester phosphodiesterase [Actinocatenispora sp.]
MDAALPLAFAHRGGAAEGDENTVAAFERTAQLGYRYVETDVQATADGVPVIFHDDDLSRLAGRPDRISSLREADLATIRIGGAQAVPRLDDVLTSWPTLRFNLDVKSWAAVEPLIATLRRTEVLDRVLVASFSDRRLAVMRRALGPRVASSMGPSEVVRLRLASVAGRGMLGLAPGVPAVQVPVRYGPIRVIDRRFVTYAHRLGIQVHAWTIDDPAEINRLLDLGVDGIMTDRIDVLREVLLSRGQWAT